jgi:nifR3 family TIM-barrel protein
MRSLPAFFVRSIPVWGDLLLSPMDGYSDMPFRSVCRELGSAMSYTEFINAWDVVINKDLKKIRQKIQFLPEERPVVFQLFDSEPDRLLEAALRLQEFGPDIIDVNMGCSASCVSGRGAGAGLLRAPWKIARIFSSLTAALDVPVTGKIRLGWDDSKRNYMLVARVIEEYGGSLVAVHGRTKVQAYKGQADWDAIAEIKQELSIPVIGNGDVRSVADISRMKAYTGCDAVMIGRAAIGNPWIFSCLDRDQVSPDQVQAMMLRHLERMLAFYGEELGLLRFRKHASHYLSPYALTKEQRERLFTCQTVSEFTSLLSEHYRVYSNN